MKISAMPSMTVQTSEPQPSRVDSIRSLKMTTNATPLSNQNQQAIPVLNNQPAASEATQPLSPQLAFLAKQRRALQIREKELANREKSLASQQPTSGSAIDIAKLKSDPLGILLENGVTYDQLTQAILSGQGNSEINALKAELASIKNGIDQKFQEKDSAAEKQVLEQISRDIDQLIRNNDEFELIRTTRNRPNVVRLIEKTFKDTGELLSTTEACQLVENELFKDAQKMMRLKKLQSQFSPMTQPQPQLQQRQPAMRTLTNRDTATVPLSAKARAMAAFYGTLKR